MNRTGAKKSKPFSHVNLLCPGWSWTPGIKLCELYTL